MAIHIHLWKPGTHVHSNVSSFEEATQLMKIYPESKGYETIEYSEQGICTHPSTPVKENS